MHKAFPLKFLLCGCGKQTGFTGTFGHRARPGGNGAWPDVVKGYMAEKKIQIVRDPSLHKLPPQNIEAEESILSSILIDSNCLNEIVEIISAEDFYRTAHQKIFAAIMELFAKSEPVDIVTVSNHLKESGTLEAVGGISFLARLIDTIPLAVNTEHYARIIRDKSSLRKLIERANHIVTRCFEDKGDVDEVINFAEKIDF